MSESGLCEVSHTLTCQLSKPTLACGYRGSEECCIPELSITFSLDAPDLYSHLEADYPSELRFCMGRVGL